MASRAGQSKIDIRKYRSDLAKLKKAGLISAKIDARSHAPTRYMRDQIKKFDDVLRGRAKAVSVPKRADREQYGALRQKNKRVVVPVQQGDVKVSFNKKEHRIKIDTFQKGGKIKQTLEPRKKGEDFKQAAGERVIYQVRFPNGGSTTSFENWDDFVTFMKGYERLLRPDGTLKREAVEDWARYLVTSRIKADGSATVDFGTGGSAWPEAQASKRSGKKSKQKGKR